MPKSNITTPMPFVRDLCGPGNRVELPYNKKAGVIVLPGWAQDAWDSPLTGSWFQEAAKSIAAERAWADKQDVTIVRKKGVVVLHVALAPAKSPKVIKPAEADKELMITAGAVTYMVHRYVRMKTLKGKTEHEINQALSDAHRQVHFLTKALEAQ